MKNQNLKFSIQENDSLIKLKHISDELKKLSDQGWNHLSIIKSVDKFFEGKAINNTVVTDIHDNTYTVSEHMYYDPSLKPGNAVLFKDNLKNSPSEKFHIDDKCGFLERKDVGLIFGEHLF